MNVQALAWSSRAIFWRSSSVSASAHLSRSSSCFVSEGQPNQALSPVAAWAESRIGLPTAEAPEDVGLLRNISVVDRVDEATAIAISGEPDAAHRLYQLAGVHSFVTSVSSPEGDTYRLHQLVRELLVAQLPDSERRALMQKAAAHLERIGRVVEAASVYVAVADEAPLLNLLRREGERLLGLGHARLLEEWFSHPSNRAIASDCQLLALRAQVEADLGQFVAAEADFSQAIAGLLDSNDRSAALEALRRLAGLHERRGAYGLARETLQRAMSFLAPEDRAQSLRIQNQMATLLLWSGNPEAALQLIQEVVASSAALGDRQRQAIALHNLGSILHTLGRLAEARDAFLAALVHKRALELWSSIALSLNSLGVVYQQLDSLTDSESVLNESLALAERSGSTFVRSYALSNLGDLERDRGALDRAVALYERSIQLKQAMGNPFAIAHTWNCLATLQRRAGDLVRARENNTRALQLRQDEAGPLEQLLFREEAGRIAAAMGDFATARDELESVAAQFQRLGARYLFTRCAWHAAYAAWRLTRTIPARVAAILEIADQMGYRALLSTMIGETPDFALAVWAQSPVASGALLSAVVEHADRILPQIPKLLEDDAVGANDRIVQLLTRLPGNEPLHTLVKLSHHKVNAVASAAASALDEVRAAPLAPLRIQVFGGLQVSRRGRPIADQAWHRHRAKELLGFLLLAGSAGCSRDELIVGCWPDATPESGIEQFHSHLHALRAALEPEAVRGVSRYIVGEGRVYRLVFDLVESWDYGAFESAVRAARAADATGDADAATQLYATATDLYRGPLLAGLESEGEWLETARQRCLNIAIDASLRLAELRTSRGDPLGAARAWESTLALDPYREDAHRALMRLYASLGRRDEALAQYRRCVAALHLGLEVDPGPETRALYRQLLAS